MYPHPFHFENILIAGLLFISISTGCKEEQPPPPQIQIVPSEQPADEKAVSVPDEHMYSTDTLLTFLTHVEHMSFNNALSKANSSVDSVFHQHKPLQIPISANANRWLKKAEQSNWVPTSVAKKLFYLTDLEPNQQPDSIYINVFQLNETGKGNNTKVISFGPEMMDWDTDLYFIRNDTIIAWQHNYHRYGPEIDAFQDEWNRTVVYYTECFGSGAGIAEFHWFFYVIDSKGMHPLMTTLHIANLCAASWLPREFYLDAEIVHTNPLQIKYKTEDVMPEFYDETEDILKDSFIVHYSFSPDSMHLTGKFPARFPEVLLTNYYTGTDNLLYTKRNAGRIRNYLTGSDEHMRRVYQLYVSRLITYAGVDLR